MHDFDLQAILTMDTYQWFVTILNALLSIFIALSVTVAIDRALFSARYAYMNVSSLLWLCLQLLFRAQSLRVIHIRISNSHRSAPCSAQQ